MPDMSKPGAHLQDLVETLRFKQQENADKSRDCNLRSEIYQECAWKLEQALREEALADVPLVVSMLRRDNGDERVTEKSVKESNDANEGGK